MNRVKLELDLTIQECIFLKRFIRYGREAVSINEINLGIAKRIGDLSDKINKTIDIAVEKSVIKGE